MVTKDTRQHILVKGLALFLQKGYTTTGLKNILDEAGVPKGSFYHFFPGGKEAFAAEVVDLYATMAKQARQDLLFKNTRQGPILRLLRYFEHYQNHFATIGFREGCLLGDFSAEVCDGSDAIRQRVEAAYQAWEKDVALVITEAIERGDMQPIGSPTHVARYLINGWEGALLRMKAEKTAAALDEFITLTFNVLLAAKASQTLMEQRFGRSQIRRE